MDQGILDTQLFLTVILGLYRENIKTAFNQMNENLNEKSIQNALSPKAYIWWLNRECVSTGVAGA